MAAVAAVPLLALVTYSAVSRYDTDRARARAQAGSRAQLYGALLAREADATTPSHATLGRLLALSPLPAGSALVVFDGQERTVARAGSSNAGPPLDQTHVRAALARRRGTFETRGGDGVGRVWGLAPVHGAATTVAFAFPGEAARTGLERDLLLAAAAALAALAVALLLAGRATAPLRRLAGRVADNGGSTNDIGTLERGLMKVEKAAEERAAELARRAERHAGLRAIDRAILAAETPQDIAQAALGRLRELVGAEHAEVLLFEPDSTIVASLAVARTDGTASPGAVFASAGELLDRQALADGRACLHADLDVLDPTGDYATMLRAQRIRSYAAVALAAEGETMGALTLGFAEPAAVGDDALTAGAEVADQLAIALRHARVHDELQAVVDGALDGIVVVDSKRRFISVNEPASRLLGRPREELIGLSIDDVVAASSGEVDFERVLAEGSSEGTVRIELASGQSREIEVRGRANFRPGRHLFAVRDITERRRLEHQLRQRHKMEAVGQLAGGVAHDFNNLLTAISGYSAIARRRIGVGPGADELTEIEHAAERAAQLTRQLLAFSRQQVSKPVTLDLNQVINGVLPMLGRLIGEDIKIAVLADEPLPGVLADRAQIEQVIINLALNARDAMPTGGTLTIETRGATLDHYFTHAHPGVDPGDYACLSVTDTGCGIEPEVREHIFEPFYTTKQPGSGTGLGLATVQRIVSQCNGHVLVYSEPELGATFKVYLPAKDTTIAPTPSPDATPLPLGGTETILLCEDEDVVRRLIETILTHAGYTVLATGTPRQALAVAGEHTGTIAALVTDVVMPGISGPDLAGKIRALRPEMHTIFLSGYTAEIARERGNLPQDSTFLQKPFDRETLLQTIRNVLHQSRQPPASHEEALTQGDA